MACSVGQQHSSRVPLGSRRCLHHHSRKPQPTSPKSVALAVLGSYLCERIQHSTSKRRRTRGAVAKQPFKHASCPGIGGPVSLGFECLEARCIALLHRVDNLVIHAVGVDDLFLQVRVRFQIIGNACIKTVGKSQSCMVFTLPIIWKQTVQSMQAMA